MSIPSSRAALLAVAAVGAACTQWANLGGLEPADSGSTGVAQPGDCGLEQPAFCATFETAHPGGRGGELDERVFGFARWGHQVQYSWERAPAHTYPDDYLFPATFCGAPFDGVLPDEDVRTCDGAGVDGTTSGQLEETFDDQAATGVNALRVRQPFDFAGRVGKIVWDVDAKVNPLNTGQGWWMALWLTAEPTPLASDARDGIDSFPRNGVGFTFAFGADCPETADDWQNALEGVVVTNDYQIALSRPFWELEQADARCFRVADAHLNHFELRLSEDAAELWASDYDEPASLQLRAKTSGLGLSFQRGYVQLQHWANNAASGGHVTPSQTFRWDNIGFDGPRLPTPRAYDVPDPGTPGESGARRIGYLFSEGPLSFTLRGVDLSNATSASFNFVLDAGPGSELEYSLNANPGHTFVYPETTGASGGLHGFSVDVPLAELVPGDNVISVSLPGALVAQGIGALDLTLETSK
ncbi:MAG TPA: hypothetical protein VGQ57_20140 [Polyangiaceae bacterium]|nr:hypothetical protein [Polyangiaceae bacterium]